MEIHLLDQVQKVIKSLRSKGPQEGELHGIKVDTSFYVFACCSKATTNLHDPTLLMPGNFEHIGSFKVGADLDFSNLQPGTVGLGLSEGELKMYYCDQITSSIEEKQFVSMSETDIWETFALAKVSFYRKLDCESDESSITAYENTLIDEMKSSSTAFKTEKYKPLLKGDTKSDVKVGKAVGSISKPLDKKSKIPFCTFEVVKESSPETEANQEPVDPLIAILYLPKTMILPKVGPYLVTALLKRLKLAFHWMRKQTKDPNFQGDLKTYLINHYLVGYVMSPIYPISSTDEQLLEYRQAIHDSLFLPIVPILRKSNESYIFEQRPSSVLINTHESVAPPPIEEAMLSVVKGLYGYHHYMQDGFNDNKWGCAYRSLQTLISWFRFQGYTQKPIPTHPEIQQILVDMKDKPASFVGSKQWIGSTEVGFVLESYLDVSSRFITVNSGDDLADHGRALCLHFERVGTPIMIGGGVLAHTIIGVQWSEDTGEIMYLILDPHYTGGENINTIVNKGWCGWKDSKFWKSNAYYNLCLPQLPKGV